MRFDILALILAIVSACIAIVSLMTFVTYSSEVAALKIKIQKQDEKLEEWHIRMIERVEKAVELTHECIESNKSVLENSRDVNQLSKNVNENAKSLIEAVKEQNNKIGDLRSGYERLLLLYSNRHENEKEVSA